MNNKEKSVIIFLCLTFAIGGTISIIRNHNLKQNTEKINIKKAVIDTVSQNETDSIYEDEINVTNQTILININTASNQELEALPGIGPVIAKRIIDYRKSCNGFTSKEELLKVSGIGPKKFAAIKDKIIVSQ